MAIDIRCSAILCSVFHDASLAPLENLNRLFLVQELGHYTHTCSHNSCPTNLAACNVLDSTLFHCSIPYSHAYPHPLSIISPFTRKRARIKTPYTQNKAVVLSLRKKNLAAIQDDNKPDRPKKKEANINLLRTHIAVIPSSSTLLSCKRSHPNPITSTQTLSVHVPAAPVAAPHHASVLAIDAGAGAVAAAAAAASQPPVPAPGGSSSTRPQLWGTHTHDHTRHDNTHTSFHS